MVSVLKGTGKRSEFWKSHVTSKIRTAIINKNSNMTNDDWFEVVELLLGYQTSVT